MSVTVRVMVEITMSEELTQEVIEHEVYDLLTHNGAVFSSESLDAESVRVQMVEE